MKKEKIVVIGGGIGGLLSAVTLAKKGYHVTLIERNSQVGGYAVSTTINGCTFDIGAQDITFLGKRDIEVLKDLDLWKFFVKMTPHSKVIYEDMQMEFSDKVETLKKLIALFPNEKTSLESFFDLIDETYDLMDDFFTPDNFFHHSDVLVKLMEFSSKSAESLLSEYFLEDRLKALLGSFSVFYQGSTPAKLSSLHFLGLLSSYLKNGAFYFEGGSGKFTETLGELFVQHGGKLFTDEAVIGIETIEGNVSSVKTNKNQIFDASIVISNIDPNVMAHFFNDVLAKNFINRFIKKHTIGVSRCELFLAVSWKKNNLLPVYFLKGTYDEELEFRHFLQGDPISLRCFISTAVSKRGAPEGVHCLNIAFPADYDVWAEAFNKGSTNYEAKKIQYQEKIIYNLLYKLFPDFPEEKYFLVKELITPIDLEKMTLNSKGALYGWELTPDQTGVKRFPMKTAIGGLFYTGQWTAPGGSVCLTMRSANLVSSLIERKYE